MYIIPVTAYEQLWDAAGNPYVTTTITEIYSWTVALQSPPPTSGLPALPPEQIGGVNDLAVQIGRAKSDPDSASKSGYRFVGRWAQDANPVTAESQAVVHLPGLHQRRRNTWCRFFYPVTTAKLPKQADLTAAEMDKFNSDPQAYIEAQAEMLNALSPADWQPDLTQLDELVGSLRIEGMAATGPARYRLAVDRHELYARATAEPDRRSGAVRGRLRHGRHPDVKADCNGASGPTPTTAAWWAASGCRWARRPWPSAAPTPARRS